MLYEQVCKITIHGTDGFAAALVCAVKVRFGQAQFYRFLPVKILF